MCIRDRHGCSGACRVVPASSVLVYRRFVLTGASAPSGRKQYCQFCVPVSYTHLSLLVTDIVVEFEDGGLADIEIQKIGYAFPGERSACYSADLLLRQYKRVREKPVSYTHLDVYKRQFHGIPGKKSGN